MFSDISTILDVIIFILSGFIVASTVAAVVFVVWTFGKMNERSTTKDILDMINSSEEKTNTSLALNTDKNSELIKAAIMIIESYGLSVSGSKITPLPNQSVSNSSINQGPNDRSLINTSSVQENRQEKMLLETGHVHMKHGDFQSAIKDYTNAIVINPAFAGAYNARGMANRKMKDFHAALQDYNTALTLHNNLAATYNLSLIHI